MLGSLPVYITGGNLMFIRQPVAHVLTDLFGYQFGLLLWYPDCYGRSEYAGVQFSFVILFSVLAAFDDMLHRATP